jgi:hypothetical protein
MIDLNRIRELALLLTRIARTNEEGESTLGSNTNLDEAINDLEESPEEQSVRTFLEAFTLEELQDLESVIMLGKSFYSNESWEAIRNDVDLTEEGIIEYLMEISNHLKEYMTEGFTRLLNQENIAQR